MSAPNCVCGYHGIWKSLGFCNTRIRCWATDVPAWKLPSDRLNRYPLFLHYHGTRDSWPGGSPGRSSAGSVSTGSVSTVMSHFDSKLFHCRESVLYDDKGCRLQHVSPYDQSGTVDENE